jgi:hypothetical protein
MQEKGRYFLQTKSKKSTSALMERISFDPNDYSNIRWSWKADRGKKGTISIAVKGG